MNSVIEAQVTLKEEQEKLIQNCDNNKGGISAVLELIFSNVTLEIKEKGQRVFDSTKPKKPTNW